MLHISVVSLLCFFLLEYCNEIIVICFVHVHVYVLSVYAENHVMLWYYVSN